MYFVIVVYVSDLRKFLTIWLTIVNVFCRTTFESIDTHRNYVSLSLADNLWCLKFTFHNVFSWKFLMVFLFDFLFLLMIVFSQCLIWRQESMLYFVYGICLYIVPLVLKDFSLVRSMVKLSDKVNRCCKVNFKSIRTFCILLSG